MAFIGGVNSRGLFTQRGRQLIVFPPVLSCICLVAKLPNIAIETLADAELHSRIKPTLPVKFI